MVFLQWYATNVSMYVPVGDLHATYYKLLKAHELSCQE